MSRLLKCYGEDCVKNNIKHPKEALTKYKSKNYCNHCLDKLKKQEGQKDKLFEYIKEQYDILFVTPLMQKHINEMRAHGLSYKMVHALIHYCLEVKDNFNKPDPKFGLFLYSNYYEEMLQYYKNKKLKKQQNENKKIEKKTVTIDSTKLNRNTYKNSKLYDMEE